MPRGTTGAAFLLFLALGSRGSLAAEAAAVPAATVKVTAPPDLALQPGKEVAVEISVLDQKNQPMAGVVPRVDASSGSFGELTDLGGGRFRAVYHMPSERHPQAVILAAKVPGSAPGWAVMLLRSHTELPVNTDKPSVMVTLSLGGRIYGPVRTDAMGKVKIPVEVAPNDKEALAEAVDEFGNRTRRRVIIPVPPSPILVGFAERSELAADGEDSSNVYLVVVDPEGSPSTKASFLASKTQGSISTVKRLQPGLYQLHYTAPRGLTAAEAQLTLFSKEFPKLSRRTFTFRLLHGRPDRLQLTAEPQSMVADGKSRVALKMSLADRGGNPLDGLVPTLRCSSGVVGEISGAGHGSFQAFVTSPPRTTTPMTCTAQLDRGDLPPLRSEVTVQLTPPLPGSMDIVSEVAQLPMDGKHSSAIRIELRDRSGSPLEGAVLRAATPIGSLTNVLEEGAGRYHTIYTAPRGTESTRVRIAFETGEGDHLVQQQVVLSLEGVAPPPPPAPLLTLGPSAGVATNFGPMLYASFGLEGAVRLPFAADTLYLGLETGYRFGQHTGSSTLTGVSVQTRLGVSPLHLLLVIRPMPHSIFTPVIELGGGLEFVQWSITGIPGGEEKDHQFLWGAAGSLGGEVRLGTGALFLSVRYQYAYLVARGSLGQDGVGQGSLIKGNVGGLDVGLGYRIFF